MVHFIRSVNHRIIDVFIGQTEEVCYCYDQFLDSFPYSFSEFRQSLRLLEGDFQDPSLGIYFVCTEEVKSDV